MNREITTTDPVKSQKARPDKAVVSAEEKQFSLDDMKPMISQLTWDRDVDENYYVQLLQKENPTASEERQLQALYIKILNFNNWHTIVKSFGLSYVIENMLTEQVIHGLFPRPLRKKYEFVRNVLSEAV